MCGKHDDTDHVIDYIKKLLFKLCEMVLLH